MRLSTIVSFLSLALAGSACEEETFLEKIEKQARVAKRADPPAAANVSTPRWSYDAAYDWARLDPRYQLCQTGTTQSPVGLSTVQGISFRHILKFNYSTSVVGNFYNWGYGPAFELGRASVEGCTVGSTAVNCTNVVGLPSITWDEYGVSTTAYLVSWHIHSPGDHTVQNDRSKAELHLVHVDASGKERAVLAIRIDPSTPAYSRFIGQVPFPSSNTTATSQMMPSFNQTGVRIANQTINPLLSISEVGNMNEFWTYKGSLTSPPCTEGIRFFVARQLLFVSNKQMQDILAISLFSARQEQEVWMHEINV